MIKDYSGVPAIVELTNNTGMGVEFTFGGLKMPIELDNEDSLKVVIRTSEELAHLLGVARVLGLDVEYTENKIEVTTETELVDAISEASAGSIISLSNDIVVTNDLTLDKSVTIEGNGATIEGELTLLSGDIVLKDVTVSNYLAVLSDSTVLDNVTISDINTGVTSGKGTGKYIVKVSDGDFTMKNCTMTSIEGKAYNAINIATDGKVVIEDNRFETMSGVYNTIEFSQSKPLSNVVIKNNYFTRQAGTHNIINMFIFEEGAVITIEGNTFEYSANAVRLSNYTNASATFNIINNTYNDGDTDEWGGFMIFQAPHVDESFANFTVNVTNLVGPAGTKINTVEGDGTGANRLGYYYGDNYENQVMPDETKAVVNFLD